MKKLVIGFILSLITASLCAATEPPYKGQHQRNIKALSQAEIDAYLNGKGMGLAKAAELNHYPGPRHVLDIKDELNLSETQTNNTQDLFNRMLPRAIELGEQLVNKEKELDRLFAEGSINTATLNKSLSEIGSLQVKLRYVHLSAHLKQKQILTKHQIMLYDRLRGYSAASHVNHTHSH